MYAIYAYIGVVPPTPTGPHPLPHLAPLPVGGAVHAQVAQAEHRGLRGSRAAAGSELVIHMSPHAVKSHVGKF